MITRESVVLRRSSSEPSVKASSLARSAVAAVAAAAALSCNQSNKKLSHHAVLPSARVDVPVGEAARLGLGGGPSAGCRRIHLVSASRGRGEREGTCKRSSLLTRRWMGRRPPLHARRVILVLLVALCCQLSRDGRLVGLGEKKLMVLLLLLLLFSSLPFARDALCGLSCVGCSRGARQDVCLLVARHWSVSPGCRREKTRQAAAAVDRLASASASRSPNERKASAAHRSSHPKILVRFGNMPYSYGPVGFSPMSGLFGYFFGVKVGSSALVSL
jgi:hypothetical protein